MKKPELLLPAGNMDTLKTAIRYGADAVYIGGEAFSLRAKADNFDLEGLREAVSYAHGLQKKVYVTVNIFAHNAALEPAKAYLEELEQIRPDALIISDPGLFRLARAVSSDLDLHISTQMNSTNYESFLFWHELGAKRVVNARELSLTELSEIRERIPKEMEIESFVHGAMCISYSGRCLMSAYMTGRSANEGACTHPCRWNYAVVEEKRPGEYFPVEEDAHGTYIFNSKDLCMIGRIPEMLRAGIDSFKVEGRMKTELYVAAIGSAYRRAIDDYFDDPDLYQRNIPLYQQMVRRCTYREFTTGFYFGAPDHGAQIYDSNTYVRGCTYFGRAEAIEADRSFHLEQKNKFAKGDTIGILKPDGSLRPAEVLRIRDAAELSEQESCPHARQQLLVTLSTPPETGDLLCSLY